MKIGVFDSGVGGKAFADAIERALPEAEVVLKEDKDNLPYGDKTPEELLKLTLPILQQLVSEGCEVIVIACNTVTTNIINELRQKLSVPLIGTEPMIKPAAEQTKTGVIGVCATPATLKSKRYTELKELYAKDVKVIEPDCSDWARMIEDNQVNHQKLEETLSNLTDANADVVVLGCTHYHWIQDTLQQYAKDKAIVIQPEQAVIAELKRVLSRLV